MTDAAHDLPDRFAVGDWTVDRNTLSIRTGTETHQLEPRVFGVLHYLAGRPGQLVTIDELMDALWPGVVVTPNAVTRVIAQLRKAIGDDAKQPQYIQTVARSGYRLIADVTPLAATRSIRRPHYAAVLAALVLGLGVVTALWMLADSRRAPTVAVLPFQNLTGDPALAYLGEGVAEEVIHTLGQVSGLDVSARTISFRFRDDGQDALAFAEALDVAYLVTGSVRRSGSALRITAKLISTQTGHHLWSHEAELDPAELFSAQDAVSSGVMLALTSELGLPAPVVETRQAEVPNPEAYDLYLRGRYVWHRRGTMPVQPAIDAFAEAVKIDPEFARGWAALASAYLTFPGYSPNGYATWELAEDAAKKALELDPSLAEPYGVLAAFAQTRLDWIGAHRLFLEGLTRGPDSATMHYWYSEHLAKTGRYRDSLRHIRQSRELDPTYMAPRIDTAFIQLFFGAHNRGAEAFETLWNAGMQDPVNWMGYFIGRIIISDFDEAHRLIDIASLPEAQKPLLHRFVRVESGMTDDRDRLVDDLFVDSAAGVDHRMLTWMGSRLHAYDRVLAMLQERLANGWFIATRPLWGPAHRLPAQPGFIEFVDAIGLVEYWNTAGWGDICRSEEGSIICDDAMLTPDVLGETDDDILASAAPL